MSLRTELLAALRSADGPLTVDQLASILDRAPTSLRFHLGGLVDDGVIAAHSLPAAGRGRPRLAYRARRTMDPAGPREYELLARVLADALAADPDGPSKAARAGHDLGTQRADPTVDPSADVIRVLSDLGFAPADGDERVRLRRCPFLEAARDQPTITCAVHRGLMQGVLDAHGSPLRITLEPFAGGDHCTATFGRPFTA